MNRRDFLRNSAACAAGTCLLPAQGISFASSNSGYGGPYYVFLQAYGGWDPTHFLDPKGGFINNYQTGDIKPMGPFNVAPTAWWKDSYSADRICYERFIKRFSNDLILLNGVAATSIVHDLEIRNSLCSSPSGSPSLMAMVAATINPDLALSFINGVELASETYGIVPQVPTIASSTLQEIININGLNALIPEKKFQNEDTVSLILQAQQSRLERIRQDKMLPGRRILLEQMRSGFKDLGALHAFAAYLPKEFHDGESAVGACKNQIDMAMSAFKSGISCAAQIRYSDFDSHSDSDQAQSYHHSNLLACIHYFMDRAEALDIRDKITFIVGSEFGRTPFYGEPDGQGANAPRPLNDKQGKDHHPVTSVLLIKSGIGPKVIGATTPLMASRKVNPLTNQVDDGENGRILSHQSVHASLRKSFCVSEELSEKFPIEDNTIFNFFG